MSEKSAAVGYVGWGGPYRGTVTDCERLAERVGPDARVGRAGGTIEVSGQHVPAYSVFVPPEARLNFEVWLVENDERE